MNSDPTDFKSKEEIISFIKDNPRSYVRIIKAFNKSLYQEVNSWEGKSFGEKMYIYLHGKKGCWRCGCDTTFVNIFEGYRNACKSCYEDDRALKLEMGPPPKCVNPDCSNPVTEHDKNKRWKQHCGLKCRGVHNSVKSRGKTKQVWMEKYGVDHPRKTKESFEKLQDTIEKKYGVRHIMHIEGVKEKIETTNLERRGVSCAFQCPEVKKKIEDTNIKIYGTKNVSQNKDVHRLKLRSGKQYLMGDGQMVSLQGYEPNFLDVLSNAIKVESKLVDVPSIPYSVDGEQKVYFPDFFMEEYNLVIEIKSEYTIRVDTTLITNKMIGTILNGYDYLLVVMKKNPSQIVSTMFFNSDVVTMMEDIGYDSLFEETPDGCFSQYVKDGVSINVVHPFFINNKLTQKAFYNHKITSLGKHMEEVLFFSSYEVKTNYDVVYNFLSNKFGRSNGIYARDCVVCEIDSKEAKSFINANHLQGFTPSKHYMGLRYNDELLSVMSFSLPRKGVGKQRDKTFELVRFCSKGRVVGGASKILKNFMNMYPDHSIVSYSDNRYSDGGLYETLGFELESSDNVSYGYIRFGSDEVVNRFNFTKYKLTEMASYREDLSETQIMDLEGYFRVYDAGKKTWIKKPTLSTFKGLKLALID
jgi:hypothetical protein